MLENLFNNLKIGKVILYIYVLIAVCLKFSLSQIAEEKFSTLTSFSMDEKGQMSFKRKTNTIKTESDKEEYIYSLILSKIRELDSDNIIVRETSNFKFSKISKEALNFMNQNATKLTFKLSFNTSQDDSFYNPNSYMDIYVYFFKNEIQKDKSDKSLNDKDVVISFSLNNYNFCENNSTFSNCILTPASENSTTIYKIGKYLEFEFNFSNNENKSYKLFLDNNLGHRDSGDFVYSIGTTIEQDGEKKIIETKDFKLNKDKALLRFSRFDEYNIFSFTIDTDYLDSTNNVLNKIINLSTDNLNVNIEPKGGEITFTKEENITNPEINTNNSKFLKISFKSIQELDKTKQKLITFNNLDHFINNFVNLTFNTNEFINDKFYDIPVKKSNFFLKNKPKQDAIISGEITVFEKEARILLDGERSTKVKEGDVLFKIEVLDWPFCQYNKFGYEHNCPTENPIDPPNEGVYLEIALEISGSKTPFILPYSQDRYSNEYLSYIFTGFVKIDNRYQKLDIQNQSFSEQNNKKYLILTLPLFSKRASANILIDMNVPEGPYFVIIYLIGAMAFFSAGFIVYMCISKKIKKENNLEPNLLMNK